MVGTLSESFPHCKLLFLNAVGSVVGFFIGACMGMSTESGVLRGAGVGALSGGVFCTEAVESCIEIWRSSESGKYSILFVVSVKELGDLFFFHVSGNANDHFHGPTRAHTSLGCDRPKHELVAGLF